MKTWRVVHVFIHNAAMSLHALWLRLFAENDIGRGVRIALRAYIDLTNPHGVHIGDGTLVETRASILAHNPSAPLHTDTYIGRNCYIGISAMVMPGTRIGDQSIVMAGSLVRSNIAPGSIVAGNPARVVRSGIRTGKYGRLLGDGRTPATQEETEARAPTTGDFYPPSNDYRLSN